MFVYKVDSGSFTVATCCAGDAHDVQNVADIIKDMEVPANYLLAASSGGHGRGNWKGDTQRKIREIQTMKRTASFED